MNKCGIYVIKNTINDKVYVGQSVDIERRYWAHVYSAKNDNRQDSYTQIHSVMRNLGIDNFYYEVLEQCDITELDAKEIYYINKFNSYYNGYNMTLGGEGNSYETNGRAILKLPQVIEIRMMYGAKIPFREAYSRYEGIISKRGFRKVWGYETWKGILPEVYSEENMLWHATFAKSCINGNKNLGYNNTQRACSKSEITKMRMLREQGYSYEKISQQTGRSISVVRKYCLHKEAKNPQSTGPAHKAKSIRVKNKETGLVFDSLKKACEWAGLKDSKDISLIVHGKKDINATSGIVQSTGEPAHWELA